MVFLNQVKLSASDEVVKAVFQPVGRGWTHFWPQLDLIGKAKDAGHELLADADQRGHGLIADANQRVDDLVGKAKVAMAELESKTIRDASALIAKGLFWLFLCLSGVGAVAVGLLRRGSVRGNS